MIGYILFVTSFVTIFETVLTETKSERSYKGFLKEPTFPDFGTYMYQVKNMRQKFKRFTDVLEKSS